MRRLSHAVMAVVLLASCSAADEELASRIEELERELEQVTSTAGSTQEPASTTTTAAAPTTTADTTTSTTLPEATSERGSRDDPLGVGQSAQLDDWTVAVVELDTEATDFCLSGNSFNDPPSNGTYVLVRINATYTGEDEGDAYFELGVVLVGNDARQYSDTDSIGVWPDDMSDQPTVENGGNVEGNFCLDVPPDAIPGSILFIEPTLSFDDTRAYWAVGETG